MKYGVRFTATGWTDFKSWFNDKIMLRRLERVIEDLRRDPEGQGLGKRERLRASMSGWNSLRVTEEHRLIYRVDGDWIEIISCRGHYTD